MQTADNGKHGEGQDGFVDGTAADNMVVDQRIYRKTLTMATIDALPERAVVNKRTTLLCRIGGEIRGVAIEYRAEDANKPEAQRQSFTALVGEFEADTYSDDGEFFSFYAGQCYLPTGFHDAVLTQFRNRCDELQAAKDTTTSPFIRFNLEFASEPAPNPRGYRYIARNMSPVPRRTDALAMQRETARLVRASGDLPALDGPRRGMPAIEDQRTA